MKEVNKIHQINCLDGLKGLENESVQCCITSPPYWRLRDYGVDGQLGQEPTPEQYVEELVKVFGEVYRVLKEDGTLWLNLGDVYWGSGKAGSNPEYQKKHMEFGKPTKNTSRYGKPVTGKHPEIKSKDLVGLPWMVALALRKKGWYLRQDIIWHKANHMPESVTDRCVRAHEYIFLFSKKKKYYFNHTAIRTIAKGKSAHDLISRPAKKGLRDKLVNCFNTYRGPYLMANKRSVWHVANKPYRGAHTATFPPEIPTTCILAGSKVGDLILDPFMGAGTTAMVAKKLKRQYIGFELNPQFIALAEERIMVNSK